jgi:hypothetical protein
VLSLLAGAVLFWIPRDDFGKVQLATRMFLVIAASDRLGIGIAILAVGLLRRFLVIRAHGGPLEVREASGDACFSLKLPREKDQICQAGFQRQECKA